MRRTILRLLSSCRSRRAEGELAREIRPAVLRRRRSPPCDNPAMRKKLSPAVLVASLFLVPSATGTQQSSGADARLRALYSEGRGLTYEMWRAKQRKSQFHDAILAIDSVALPVMEQRITQFIADAGAAPGRVLADPGATREP